MQITLSESRLSELINQLEGTNLPVDEFAHRMDRLAAKVFGHLGHYGIKMQGLSNQNGNLATFSLSLDPSYDDESRDTRLAGLRLLNPVSVSLNANDLPAFVLNKVALAGIRTVWPDIMREFDRILPTEIMSKLEEAANYANKAPGIATSEGGFKKWCIENGLPIPGLEQEREARRRQQEAAEHEAAQKAAEAQRWSFAEGGPSNIHIAFDDDGELEDETDGPGIVNPISFDIYGRPIF